MNKSMAVEIRVPTTLLHVLFELVPVLNDYIIEKFQFQYYFTDTGKTSSSVKSRTCEHNLFAVSKPHTDSLLLFIIKPPLRGFFFYCL